MTMIQINLLPQEMRRQSGGLRMSKSTLLGVGGALAIAVVLTGVTFFQMARLNAVERDIAQAQAKVDELQDDIMLVDRLEDVKNRILRRMEAIETLDRNRGRWVSNVEDILAVIPNYLWLSNFRKEVQQRPVRGVVDTVVVPDNRYLFKGYCFTVSSLANLILNMQDSPRFDKVELKNATLQKLEDRNVYEFEVVCNLEAIDDPSDGFEDESETPMTLGQFEQTEDTWADVRNVDAPQPKDSQS